MVFFHGGGWVIGDVPTYDPFCQHLAVGPPRWWSASSTASPPSTPSRPASRTVRPPPGGRRRTPPSSERPAASPWPATPRGATWPPWSRAGARDAGGPLLSFQLLCYPVTDGTGSSPSVTENAEGYLLTKADMEWFIGHYLDGTDPADPDVSPLFADDLTGLPPAVVLTAEYDPLRDEGEAYSGTAGRSRGRGDRRALRRDDPRVPVHGRGR